MNEKESNSNISVQESDVEPRKDASVSTETNKLDDGQPEQPTSTSWPTEDDSVKQSTTKGELQIKDREPMFVIVDSSCVSNPSSRELLIDSKINRKPPLKKATTKKIQPIDMPSTSANRMYFNVTEPLKTSDSTEELIMVDINLQKIPEKEPFIPKSSHSTSIAQRTLAFISRQQSSYFVIETQSDPKLKQAVDYLHQDNEFLIAAENGDVRKLQNLLRGRDIRIQQVDQLGRNALHLAVCSENIQAVTLLLQAGVNPNVKDNVGMTPLSLCLWRNPSIKVVDLLFNYGARLLSRSSEMDTGLFLQFVLHCKPTLEEELILRRLVENGALVNDPEAPGGRQALHLAAMSNNCELIEVLISLGADVFATNHRNQTPKQFAKAFKCKEAYNLLNEWERAIPDTESESELSEDDDKLKNI